MICSRPRCTGAGAPERSQQVIAKSDSPMRIRRLFAVNRRGRCPHRPGRTHRFCGNLRVYLKTPNAPGQRAFLRCAASFFLEIRQYSCEKMSCATQKSLAAGHIMSFQIHPRATCQPSRWNAVLSSAISASLMWTMLPRLWESRMELAVSSMTSSRSNACRSELPVTITQSFSTMATG